MQLPEQALPAAGSTEVLGRAIAMLPEYSPAWHLIGQIFKHFADSAEAAAKEAWMIPGLHLIALAVKQIKEIMADNTSADVSYNAEHCNLAFIVVTSTPL